AGKTTLISQLCGEQFPDAGKVRFNGRDITKASGPARAKMGIARSFQITTVFQDMTLLENVALAAQAHDGHSYRFWRDANSEPEINRQAMERLKEVGLDAKAMVLSREVSHGEHRQLEIAMALATAPKMLLLDEP
ncbi:MAG TPA: ABC transporter ATP-binding protein, partial [Rhodospirillaceae bacterium]|nr:ABC transporter ATP-binding protein [Rhodospirillaceae bacterium]